jgi:hypothetical protein
MSRKKNISKNVPNGKIVHTDDKYFYKSGGYSKRRMAVVVDSNKNNDLAIVKLTTSEKGKAIRGYKKGKSRFRPNVYTYDNEGKPIRLDSRDNGKRKFVLDDRKTNDMSKKDVNFVKKQSLFDDRFGIRNRRRLKNLKGRK